MTGASFELSPADQGPLFRFFERRGWALALALVALGFALRIGGLTGFWINPDEGIYMQATQSGEGLWAIIEGNAHPPLYYTLLYCVSALSEDFTALRGVSLVAGCFAIFGVYLLGRELGGVGAGLLAALLLAIAPSAIEHSQIIRPYMPLVAFLTYGLWGLTRYLRTRERRALVLYATFMTLAVLTHYSAFMVVAGMGIALGLLLLGRGIDRVETKPLFLGSLPILVTMVVLYFGHLRGLQDGVHQEAAQSGWLKHHMIEDLSETWMHLVGVVRYFFRPGNEGLALVLLLGGLVLAVWQRRHLLYAVPISIAVVSIGAAWAKQHPFSMTRHSMYLLPILLVPMVLPIAAGLRRRWVWAVLTLLVTVGSFYGRGTLNELTGASRYVEGPLPEQVIRFDSHTRGFGVSLGRAAGRGAPILMSTQTFYTMLPWFNGAQNDLAQEGEDWFCFDWENRWGNNRDLVARSWMLTFDPKPEKMAFEAFLDHVDREMPELRIRQLREITIPIVGWDVSFRNELLLLQERVLQRGGERFLTLLTDPDPRHLNSNVIMLDVVTYMRHREQP